MSSPAINPDNYNIASDNIFKFHTPRGDNRGVPMSDFIDKVCDSNDDDEPNDEKDNSTFCV